MPVYTMLSRKRKATTARSKSAKGKFRKLVTATRRAAPLRTGGFFGASVRSKAEKKVTDLPVANYACDTTGTVTLLNGVSTGTDYTQRIGRRIHMKSLYIRGIVQPEDSSTNANLARIIILYDTQTNTTLPNIGDILEGSSSISHLNLNNRSRFKVLADMTYAMGTFNTGATVAVAGSPTVHSVERYIKLSHSVFYNGTAATIGSIDSGSLLMVTMGSVIPGTGTTAVLTTRVRWTDP